MEPPQYAPEYLAGVRFFNQRDFFESHEILEDIWNECDLASRDFYQGLIQAAVALHHFGNGNVWGARKLFWSSRKYLDPYRPFYAGLNVDGFLDEMAFCFEQLISGDEAPADVQVDPELIPIIELDPPPSEAAWSQAASLCDDE